MGNNYGKLACNARKENICFRSRMISGFSSSDAYIDVQQKFKVTGEEAQKLKELSKQRNLSTSEYIRQCALNEDTIPVIDKAPVILTHLASLSTLLNSLEPFVDDGKDNTVKLMQEEVLSLWQSLT